jgi:hypothetical protein
MNEGVRLNFGQMARAELLWLEHMPEKRLGIPVLWKTEGGETLAGRALFSLIQDAVDGGGSSSASAEPYLHRRQGT